MAVLGIMFIGAVVGWLASILLRIEDGRILLVNALIGLAGAFLVGLVVAPLLLEDTQPMRVDWQIVAAAMLGALLAVRLMGKVQPSHPAE